MSPEETKQALIVVRTYPVPVPSGIESSCTAAITEGGEWLRLFPVPWRLLPDDQRFRKYQWVEVRVTKATDDARHESFKLKPDGIRVLSEPLPSKDCWRARKHVVLPLLGPTLCGLIAKRDAQQFPTLGIVRPATISRLRIVPEDPQWSPSQLGMLRQTHLFVEPPKQELEKIPARFIYEFRCGDDGCRKHNLMCTDWEMSESYRRWHSEYGDGWETKFRERYETEMIHKKDTHFFVGTVASYPNRWIIVGLFYPPIESQPSLFSTSTKI
jgi:hypothetical protein